MRHKKLASMALVFFYQIEEIVRFKHLHECIHFESNPKDEHKMKQLNKTWKCSAQFPLSELEKATAIMSLSYCWIVVFVFVIYLKRNLPFIINIIEQIYSKYSVSSTDQFMIYTNSFQSSRHFGQLLFSF